MTQRKVYSIPVGDIEDIHKEELEFSRLQNLYCGHGSFEEVLGSKSDPITLDGTSKPYKITDGRHRIFMAREKGYSHVPAIVFLSEAKVNEIVRAKACQSVYDRYNQTEDFANGDAFVTHASSLFNGHVMFKITDLTVTDMENKRICRYKMGCKVVGEARDDLSLLGVGIAGCLL